MIKSAASQIDELVRKVQDLTTEKEASRVALGALQTQLTEEQQVTPLVLARYITPHIYPSNQLANSPCPQATPLVHPTYITPANQLALVLQPQRAAETEATLSATFSKKVQEQSMRLVGLEAEKSRLDAFIQVVRSG